MESIPDIGRSASYISYGSRASPYTGIEITVNESTVIKSGTDSGNILRVDCPWGTQEMADSLLQKFSGVTYQPFSASRAIIDPAVGIGDAITVDGKHTGIFSKSTVFSPLMKSNISAPGASESEHEYEYVSKIERELARACAGYAGGLGAANTRMDGIEEDIDGFKAQVGTVEAGMEAYVRRVQQRDENRELVFDSNGNPVWTEESATAEAFALTTDVTSWLSLKADQSEVDGILEGQTTLGNRIGTAESTLATCVRGTRRIDPNTNLPVKDENGNYIYDNLDASTIINNSVNDALSKMESHTWTDQYGTHSLTGLSSSVGTLQSGLSSKVDLSDIYGTTNNQIDRSKPLYLSATAAAELYVTSTGLDDKVDARMGVYKLANGKTLAEISADTLNLGDVAQVYHGSGGQVDGLGVTGSIRASLNLSVGENIYINGNTSGIYFGADGYTPSKITTVKSFTQALGAESETEDIWVLAFNVKDAVALSVNPGETVEF